MVKEYFKADIPGAMKSARQIIFYYEQNKINDFIQLIKNEKPDLYRNSNSSLLFVNEIKTDRFLLQNSDYRSIFSEEKFIYESPLLYGDNKFPEFQLDKDGLGYLTTSVNEGDFLIIVFPLKNKNTYLLLGKKLHPGLEKDIKHFSSVFSVIQNQNQWKEQIPTMLRLILALIYIFMIAAALIVSILIARQISFPIVSLAAATRAVTDGVIETRLDIKAGGEIGILIESFNQMTEELKNLRAMQLHTQRVAAWQEVARRLAHEIKNPLTPIQLSADRMLRRLENPEKGDLDKIVRIGASTIREQVTILKGMVEEFANFARMPVAKPVLQSLNPIIQEAVNLFREISGITIETRLEEDLPSIFIDKMIIMGLVNNLIKNAVEAINSQENIVQKGTVRVATFSYQERDRTFVTLVVEDSGPGIDENMRDRIFEPYFSTKGEHGSGLGLAMVERAVLDHDARIYVGRSPLGGAEFRIVFRNTEDVEHE